MQGAVVRQAEDRAHRQGQRLPVNVYFLCAKGTSDDRRCCALRIAAEMLIQLRLSSESHQMRYFLLKMPVVQQVGGAEPQAAAGGCGA